MKFSLSEYNIQLAYALLKMLAESDFMSGDLPTPYIKENHILMLSEVCSAYYNLIQNNPEKFSFQAASFQNPADNGDYKGLGSEKSRGAIQFFEKIGKNLENIINILMADPEGSKLVVDSDDQGRTLVQVLKEVMSCFYPDYKFSLKKLTELKESDTSELITYVTPKNFQLCFICRDRDEKLQKINTWQAPEIYKDRLKKKDDILRENPNLIQPAVYSNNKTAFYLPLFEDKQSGELFISFGNDRAGKEGVRVSNFISVMDLEADPETEYDKNLNRIQYCKGLFTIYLNDPSRICITKYAKFFKDNDINQINNTYYRILNGEVKEVKKISKEEIDQRKKFESDHVRELVSNLLKIEENQKSHESKKMPLNSSSASNFSSSSIPSLALNPTGFMNSTNKPMLISPEIKYPERLTLSRMFTKNGIYITFPNDCYEFFSQEFQEYKDLVLISKQDIYSSEIFFSLNACEAGMFGHFFNLIETPVKRLPAVGYLNKLVYALTIPEDTLNKIVGKDNQAELKEKFRDETARRCAFTFDGLIEESSNPDLKLKSPEVISDLRLKLRNHKIEQKPHESKKMYSSSSSSSDSSKLSSSSSVMSSLASNPTGFMSSQNKPVPVFADIKNLEPLILEGEFSETGVSIYFPIAYREFFSQVFQEGVQILEDKLTPKPRIFFSRGL